MKIWHFYPLMLVMWIMLALVNAAKFVGYALANHAETTWMLYVWALNVAVSVTAGWLAALRVSRSK